MKLSEIAKIAGVSKSAVSLALNNRPGVSDETRRKVIEIARENGYIPRSLVSASDVYRNDRSVRFVACVKTEVVSVRYQKMPFFIELIHNVENAVKKAGYTLTFATVRLEEFFSELGELERSNPSAGIILLATDLEESEVLEVTRIQPNIVVVDAYFERSSFDCVVMNNAQGASLAAGHLLALGHKHIGYVESGIRIGNFEQRKQSFIRTLRERGVSIGDDDFFTVNPSIEGARSGFPAYLSRGKRSLPTALFCENDYIALGVMKALHEGGIRVPEDLSVVGFDDIPQSTIITPELTTIHVDREAMAEITVSRLLELVEKRRIQPPLTTMIGTSLVQRHSSNVPSR